MKLNLGCGKDIREGELATKNEAERIKKEQERNLEELSARYQDIYQQGDCSHKDLAKKTEEYDKALTRYVCNQRANKKVK